MEVQDIFRIMFDKGTKYDNALAKLDDYFTPRKDVPWERLQFRRTVPLRNETVSNYVIRLKQAAKYCEFGADADNHIRDQILDKWSDIEIQRKWYSEKDLKIRQTAFGNSLNILIQRKYSGGGQTILRCWSFRQFICWERQYQSCEI